MSVVWSRRRKGRKTKPYPIRLRRPFDISYLISTRQAVRMIANREVPVAGSSALQAEYDSVNRDHFQAKLPEVTIMLVNMPQVKHKAFAIPQARTIVVNAAQTRSLDEQKASLRHEMIHLSGIHGHGFPFKLWARQIDAPLADYRGRAISAEELEEIQLKRRMEREQSEQERLEGKYGLKRGEGQMVQRGKPLARVVFYENRAGGVTVRTVRSIEDVPKSTRSVGITTFDRLGYPKGETRIVAREELQNFTLTG